MPAGIQVINDGFFPAGAAIGSGGGSGEGLRLVDAATRSVLFIKVRSGTEWSRVTSEGAADALFDQISASIRRVD